VTSSWYDKGLTGWVAKMIPAEIGTDSGIEISKEGGEERSYIHVAVMILTVVSFFVELLLIMSITVNLR
jgi:hypothetical protein